MVLALMVIIFVGAAAGIISGEKKTTTRRRGRRWHCERMSEKEKENRRNQIISHD